MIYCEVSDMERAASIFLRADITKKDAMNMIDWLNNENVTQFLNEDKNVVDGIYKLIKTTPEHLLTYHFNRYGRIFMVGKNNDESIGFVKFKQCEEKGCYEMVISIGHEEYWGKGYGTKAIREALKQAFFEWRANKVVALIDTQNIRSVRAFEKNGFVKKRKNDKYYIYNLNMNRFFDVLRQ